MTYFHRICLLALLVTAQVAMGYNGPKPNIILIFTDDMGYGDLGVFHQNERVGKRHATPNLDRFAEEGVQLRRHYCPAPYAPLLEHRCLAGSIRGIRKFVTTNSIKPCRITIL